MFFSPSEGGSRVAKVEKVEFSPGFIDFEMKSWGANCQQISQLCL